MTGLCRLWRTLRVSDGAGTGRGGPNPKARRRELGDDDGCFEAALAAVRRCGGVLEHPEASYAFKKFGLGRPKLGHWQSVIGGGWVTCIGQSSYGHRLRKLTWLYMVGEPPPVDWSAPRTSARMDEGFHSREERLAARTAGAKPIARENQAENEATPPAFAELLLSIARNSS